VSTVIACSVPACSRVALLFPEYFWLDKA